MSPTLALMPPARMISGAARSSFLGKLRSAVTAELEPDLHLTCQVAVLQAAGYKKHEIAAQVGATGARLNSAMERAAAAALRLEVE